jgi:aspartate oxidase
MDLMLDYRLREILTPLLTRAADSVVREARSELASTLRDVVARAVAQELTRHRTR